MMDATAALEHMRNPKSLGVRTGNIDCFMIGTTGVIECDSPSGNGTVDVTPSEFVERFAHHCFRELHSGDFGR